MEIRTMKLSDIKPSDYNPRKTLKPEDPQYKKLAASLKEFGYVEPIIWNQQTGSLVGGASTAEYPAGFWGEKGGGCDCEPLPPR